MSRRWNWDFEHDQSAQKPGAAEPATAFEHEQGAPEPDADEPTTAFRHEQSAQEPAASRPSAAPPRPKAPIWQSWRGGGLLLAGVSLAIVAGLSVSNRHGSRRPDPGAAGGGRPGAANLGGLGASGRKRQQTVSSVLAYMPFVRKGGGQARDIALTFDDGPGPYTPRLLHVLERFHVQATFFAIGEMERYFAASTVRELRDGDVVGDHTETHPEMARLTPRQQHDQLLDQIARIELLGGHRPILFRPPYGSYNATSMRELRAMHLLMVLWSVDAGDYLRPGAGQIVHRVLAGARPGAIVLLHDAGGDRSQTIAALPSIIGKLRARGFRLVTVPQLLTEDPPTPGEPLPASLSGD
jgi:peptidoglycan/xylan/chitin deacetylase (PgdA/CDA1 family)